jgi:hypothetical protein
MRQNAQTEKRTIALSFTTLDVLELEVGGMGDSPFAGGLGLLAVFFIADETTGERKSYAR